MVKYHGTDFALGNYFLELLSWLKMLTLININIEDILSMVLDLLHLYFFIIRFLGKSPMYGLGYTTLTVDNEYSLNFTEKQNKFCLSLYYNESNSYIYLLMVLKSTDSQQKILK